MAESIRASRVVGRTFRVWFSALPQLLLVAALVHVPLSAIHWWIRDARTAATWRSAVARGLSTVEFFTIPAVVEAFAVLLVFQRLRGEAVDLGRSVATGLRRLGTVLGIAALLNAPNFVRAVLQTASGTDERAPADGGEILVAVLVGAVNLAVALVCCLSTPVALVERRSVFASLGRSEVLTRGCRGTILAIYVALYGTLGLVVVAALLLDPGIEGTLRFLGDRAASLVCASFICVLPIVLYHELREAKEGIGIDELAAVFD